MILQRPPRRRDLCSLVDTLWVYRAAPQGSFERVLPSGRMQLLINLQGDGLGDFDTTGAPLHRTGAMALQGPTTQPRLLDTSRQIAVCGVAFRPGGAFFLAPWAAELADRVLDLDHFWRGDANRLFDGLAAEGDPSRLLDRLEDELVHRLGATTPHDGFTYAVKMLGHGHPVGRVEQELGFSAHGLRRLFRARAGMTPKTFARLERFRRVVRLMPLRDSWPDLALDCGYVDQSHMIRDFKVFSGTSPARFRAVAPQKPTHYRI